MLELKLKELKNMAILGMATDITHGEIKEQYETIAYSFSKKYGLNGKLLKGLETKKFYVILGHVSNLYRF